MRPRCLRVVCLHMPRFGVLRRNRVFVAAGGVRVQRRQLASVDYAPIQRVLAPSSGLLVLQTDACKSPVQNDKDNNDETERSCRANAG